MANEITISASLAVNKDGSLDSIFFGPLSITFTGNKFIHHKQAVGTIAEPMVLGEISPGGLCIMLNRDSTNYVAVRGFSGNIPIMRLNPGEVALFRMDPSAVPTFTAIAGTPIIEYLLLEA